MSYQLTIKRIVDNPAFDRAAAAESDRREIERNMHGYAYGRSEERYDVPPTIDRHELTVTITDEEFLAVKRAVLEAM